LGQTVLAFQQKPRILVVEDSLLLADMVCDVLVEAGMEPVGPVPRVETALRIACDVALDGAIIDIKLGADDTFPVCRVLKERGVPFVFFSGLKRGALPAEFREVPLVTKAIEGASLRDVVLALLTDAKPSTTPGALENSSHLRYRG